MIELTSIKDRAEHPWLIDGAVPTGHRDPLLGTGEAHHDRRMYLYMLQPATVFLDARSPEYV